MLARVCPAALALLQLVVRALVMRVLVVRALPLAMVLRSRGVASLVPMVPLVMGDVRVMRERSVSLRETGAIFVRTLVTMLVAAGAAAVLVFKLETA